MGSSGPAETAECALVQESDNNWGPILGRRQTKEVQAVCTELINQVLHDVLLKLWFVLVKNAESQDG